MTRSQCHVVVVGAGPYGLSVAAYLHAAGIETRVFGEPMEFWAKQMPIGMCLRSNWGASHIADFHRAFTLDSYCSENGNHISRPIPLESFVEYGRWFQRKAAPHVENRRVEKIENTDTGFKIRLADEEEVRCTRVVVATGINAFKRRPDVFRDIPPEFASHSSEQRNLCRFRGQRVIVIGAGQSALESAALLKEAGAEVEVIARREYLNWVGLHPKLHHLGLISKLLYSDRDVGPAGISRLVAMPHVFRRFPRSFQDRTAYRAIRPAIAGWLKPRLTNIPITFGRSVMSATANGSEIQLRLDDNSDRTVDHVLLATGYRVDVSRYAFLSESLFRQLKTDAGYPVLKRGMESSIRGLHFVGKPAAWSFGPLLGFVSGTEFASKELVRSITRSN